MRAVGELSREALAAEIPSPDIYYAAVMAGPPFFKDPRVAAISSGKTPGDTPWAQQIDETTDLRTAITLARGTGATAIKIYADLPPDLVKALTTEAHRQHMLVWAHSAVFPTRPADVIAAGVDAVSHVLLPRLSGRAGDARLVRGSHAGQRKAARAERRRSGDRRSLSRHAPARHDLDATGSLFVHYDAERKAHPERRPLRCTGPETIRLTQQAWRAGVPISTGTDGVSGYEKQWPDVDDELVFLARDVGMPPLQVIHSATLIGAEAAGQAKDMGSVEAGKLANLVVADRRSAGRHCQYPQRCDDGEARARLCAQRVPADHQGRKWGRTMTIDRRDFMALAAGAATVAAGR